VIRRPPGVGDDDAARDRDPPSGPGIDKRILI